MVLVKCQECGKEISSNAQACPHCGNPIRQPQPVIPVSETSAINRAIGTFCTICNMYVTPVVTSVGGGSCSFGNRETWKCPSCKKVLHRSGCFVATATYGYEDFVEVQFLRAFRDEIMSRSLLGRVFIWIYYKLGPYAAFIVDRVPLFRPFCRKVLDRIVNAIEERTNLRRSAFSRSKYILDNDVPNQALQRPGGRLGLKDAEYS